MAADWFVRSAVRAEAQRVGDLLAHTYVKAGLAVPDDDYVPELRDVIGRIDDAAADVIVAVSKSDDEVVGTVTRCGYGSPSTTMCREGEFEFRMLAVDPAWRGRGVAAGLVNACDYFGARSGQTTSLGCAWEGNKAAQALYSKIGFAHTADRDWYYSPEEFLYVYARAVGCCPLCGKVPSIGDHEPCRRALALEPPRYCATCSRRLTVQVRPNGWSAACSRHATIQA